MRHKKARGNTMVLVAIVLPCLLGAAGLVIDWGRGVWTRTELQKAADAGALAGASEIGNETEAAKLAHLMVNNNFDSPDDAVYRHQGNNFTIILTENVPVYFMKIFGKGSMKVSVTATATARLPVTGLRGGAFPWSIINPDLNSDPGDDLTEWNYGRPYIIGYGEDNIMVQDWANGTDAPPTSPGHSSKDSLVNSLGWRSAIGLRRDGTLGNASDIDLRTVMIDGWLGTLNIGDYVPTTQGNMADAVMKGRDGRIALDPMEWDLFDPEDNYHSSRVVMVPIVHLIHDTRLDTRIPD